MFNKLLLQTIMTIFKIEVTPTNELAGNEIHKFYSIKGRLGRIAGIDLNRINVTLEQSSLIILYDMWSGEKSGNSEDDNFIKFARLLKKELFNSSTDKFNVKIGGRIVDIDHYRTEKTNLSGSRAGFI